MDTSSDPRTRVREYYGEVLTKSADLATNACCAVAAPPRYLAPLLAETRFASCFEIGGDCSTHFGVFSCTATQAQERYADGSAPSAACC